MSCTWLQVIRFHKDFWHYISDFIFLLTYAITRTVGAGNSISGINRQLAN